jgi:hypothetical protein
MAAGARPELDAEMPDHRQPDFVSKDPQIAIHGGHGQGCKGQSGHHGGKLAEVVLARISDPVWHPGPIQRIQRHSPPAATHMRQGKRQRARFMRAAMPQSRPDELLAVNDKAGLLAMAGAHKRDIDGVSSSFFSSSVLAGRKRRLRRSDGSRQSARESPVGSCPRSHPGVPQLDRALDLRCAETVEGLPA